MTEKDRKAALEWLDEMELWTHYSRGHPTMLKAMIAEPLLPREPDDIAIHAMAEAFRDAGNRNTNECLRAAVRALHARLSALPNPATKEVDVWHIEFAGAAMGLPYVEQGRSLDEAERQACKRRSEGATCVRVTGPHKQTVPA
jgi:hypothetical protein